MVEVNDYVLRVHTERTITEERFMLGHSFTHSSCSLPNYPTPAERSEKDLTIATTGKEREMQK